MEVKRRKNNKLNKRRRLLTGAAIVLLAVALAWGAPRLYKAVKQAGYRPLTQAEIAAAFERGMAAEQAAMNADANADANASAPADALDGPRASVANAALSIVGKVRYFWGGKSSAIGEDPRWGEITEVTGAGSESTGTLKPFGLDCSGYVSWCFIQLGYSFAEMEELVGNGTWNQWDRTEDIPWGELRVGDFAFMNRYPTNKGNHIGICVGFTEKGAPVFAHCSSGFDDVVVTPAGDVFRYARRPNLFFEG